MIALLASAALAGPCDLDTTGLPTGPVTIGFLDGDLGVAHRLCGRTEAALGAGGRAVVEPLNFYGHIVAGAQLDGSWAASDKTEIYATVEAFRYDSVIAPISSSYVGFGHLSLGAAHRVVDDETLGVGVHGRLVLPTAIGLYRNAWPFSLDVGAAAVWQAHRTFAVHADLAALGTAAASAGGAYPAGGARVTLGAEWRPVRPFAIVADLDAGFGYADAVDVVAAEIALRGGIGKRVGLELAVAYPFAGRERALASGELRVDVRLGKVGETPAPAPAPPL